MSVGAMERVGGEVLGYTGSVAAVDRGAVEVWTADGLMEARRAASCLVAPEAGDLILLGGPTGARPFVLAVLERAGTGATRISVEGDLTAVLPSGRFTVAATDGVALASNGAVSIDATRIDARAQEGSLVVSKARLLATTLDATIERVSQTVKRIFRRVEELEHVRAGQIDVAADGNLRMHGENTLLTARQLVKADGKQIHIG